MQLGPPPLVGELLVCSENKIECRIARTQPQLCKSLVRERYRGHCSLCKANTASLAALWPPQLHCTCCLVCCSRAAGAAANVCTCWAWFSSLMAASSKGCHKGSCTHAHTCSHMQVYHSCRLCNILLFPLLSRACSNRQSSCTARGCSSATHQVRHTHTHTHIHTHAHTHTHMHTNAHASEISQASKQATLPMISLFHCLIRKSGCIRPRL